jgi:hypothetical protein
MVCKVCGHDAIDHCPVVSESFDGVCGQPFCMVSAGHAADETAQCPCDLDDCPVIFDLGG